MNCRGGRRGSRSSAWESLSFCVRALKFCHETLLFFFYRWIFFTADILTCESRKSAGASDKTLTAAPSCEPCERAQHRSPGTGSATKNTVITRCENGFHRIHSFKSGPHQRIKRSEKVDCHGPTLPTWTRHMLSALKPVCLL